MIVACIMQIINLVILSINWMLFTHLIADNPAQIIFIMICSTVSFIAFLAYMCMYMKPLPRDFLSPHTLFRRSLAMTGSWGEWTDGETNDFNAHVGGLAPNLVKKNADSVEAFMQGAYWASSMHQLLPDEKKFLETQGENSVEIQHALTLVAAYRTSSKVMDYLPEPGYHEHPYPVPFPHKDRVKD